MLIINNINKKYRDLPLQVKASIWFFVCSFIQKFVAVATTPIFTRILNTSEYGEYNVFYSWMGIITIFVTFNIFYSPYETGLIRYENDRNHFSATLQGLELILCSIWGIVYYFTKSYINKLLELSTIHMILMLIIIWSSSAFSFWAAEQRASYKYCKLVVITLIVAFLQPILGIFFALNLEDRVVGRILGIAVVNIVMYSFLFVAQVIKGGGIFEKEYWIYALQFSIPLIPHYLAQIILVNSDRIMIERLDSSSNAGIYSLAYSISVILTIINTSINQALAPYVFRKIKNNKTKDITNITYISMFIIVVLTLLMIALSPEIIKVFAPASYYEAVYVIPPITISVFFMFSCDQFVRFQYYYKKTKWISLVTAIGAGVNVLLNFILIPVWGYRVAGYTTLLGYILYAGLHYLLMRYTCEKEMGGMPPYKVQVFLIFSMIEILLGLGLVFLYKYSIARYMFIISIIIAIVMIRNHIRSAFLRLISKID